MATGTINKQLNTVSVQCTATSKTSVNVPYPTGWGISGTIVLQTFAGLYSRQYQNADRIFGYIIALMSDHIEVDFTDADDRILNVPVYLVLGQYQVS